MKQTLLIILHAHFYQLNNYEKRGTCGMLYKGIKLNYP